MFIIGIGTAVPTARYSKSQCWDAFAGSDWFDRLGSRARSVAKAVLQRDNGIETRHLALKSLDEVFHIEPDVLNARFLSNAPLLASKAGISAIDFSGLDRSEIDAVVVSSCTGYLCPGLSSYVVEAIGLRSDVQAFDLVGQGCAAALPNLRLASALLASGQCKHVLSVCVEVCSAAMYLDDDPGVLISACLFGDGAGAMVLSQHPQQHTRYVKFLHAESIIEPQLRNLLKFEQRGGMLRNILTHEVPRYAAVYAQQALERALRQTDINQADISAWIMHPGGRDVLAALEQKIGLHAGDLRYSRSVLRDYGNLSSASVYFVMKEALLDNARGGTWWLSSFGTGFSCHGALLEVI